MPLNLNEYVVIKFLSFWNSGKCQIFDNFSFTSWGYKQWLWDIIVKFDWILSLFYHHKKLIIIRSYTNNNNIWGCSVKTILKVSHWSISKIQPSDWLMMLSQHQGINAASHNWRRWSPFQSVSHFFVLCYHRQLLIFYLLSIWNFEHIPILRRWWKAL